MPCRSNYSVRSLLPGDHAALLRSHLEAFRVAGLILTNTYHGAYWAMLAGIRTAIAAPFSTRFSTFQHPLPALPAFAWLELILTATTPASPHYLQACRHLNLSFAARVSDLLKFPLTFQPFPVILAPA